MPQISGKRSKNIRLTGDVVAMGRALAAADHRDFSGQVAALIEREYLARFPAADAAFVEGAK